MCVVGMAALAAPQVADRAPNCARLLSAGFGEAARARGDFEMARYACVALQQAFAARGSGAAAGLEPEERAKLEAVGCAASAG